MLHIKSMEGHGGAWRGMATLIMDKASIIIAQRKKKDYEGFPDIGRIVCVKNLYCCGYINCVFLGLIIRFIKKTLGPIYVILNQLLDPAMCMSTR